MAGVKQPRRAVAEPTGNGAHPADGETLAEFAYAQLRRRLVTCEIRPGSTFSESEMAQSLRLSKTPIREAFLRLRLDGLINVHARAGYSAAPVTLKDTRDICGLRALLDGEAAFRAAEYPERAARHLREHDELSRKQVADSAHDAGAAVEADAQFHVEVARASGNDRLAEALVTNLLHYQRLVYLGLAVDNAFSLATQSHAELVSAVGRGDSIQARDVATAEVRNTEQKLVQAFISSHSVSSANISIPPSSQHFYLDIPHDTTPPTRAGGTP